MRSDMGNLVVKGTLLGLLIAVATFCVGVAPARAQGGPSSVPEQIENDRRTKQVETLKELKERLEREHGLGLGADYNVTLMQASESLGARDAAGGVARLYGHWTLVHREAADRGMVVFKVEHRHRLGTSIAPQVLGLTAGAAAITAPTFSDAGALLTNLYWTQTFANNRLAFNAGLVDVTDYLDVFGLVNTWTEFSNLAFSTNPTIPAPSQGLGAVGRWNMTPNIYLVGGVADANGDPHDPGGMFESFFKDAEHFWHVELGWIDAWERRYSDNIHVSAWWQDRREEAGIESGSGIALSFSRTLAERWLPFARAGFSDGGGAVVERSVSAGIGYQLNERQDFVGLGVNWGRPASDQTEGTAGDQYSFEAYFRAQLLPQVSITPDFQFIVDPAFHPGVDHIWLLGLRVRATF